MEDILNKTKSIELTVSECVIARQALREYAKHMFGYVQEAMAQNDVAAAIIHEKTISEIMQTFGKLCVEE